MSPSLVTTTASPSIPAQSVKRLDGRNKIVMQALDQAPPPGGRNYYPAITNIIVEKPTTAKTSNDSHVYVETFLIQALDKNKKGWKVSHENPADFDRRVLESQNHPLVLFQREADDGTLIFDHPVAPITSLESAADPLRANIEFQKRYTIGLAKHFKKVKDGLWRAIYDITNPKAKKFFIQAKKKGIKLFTSPYIVRPISEERDNIREWSLVHNAIVTTPAYDETIANVAEICNGDLNGACASLFASLTAPDYEPPQELDAYAMLEAYDKLITSLDSENDLIKTMTESASSSSSSNQTLEIQHSPPQSSKLTTFYPDQNKEVIETKSINQLPNQENNDPNIQKPQQDQQQDQQPQQKQDEESKNEIALLQKQIAELTARNQEQEQRYQADIRKAEIEKLVFPVASAIFMTKTGEIDERAYNAEVKRLAASNHNMDEIRELIQARYITATANKESHKSERASITSHVDESASITDMKATPCKLDQIGANVFKKTLMNGGFI